MGQANTLEGRYPKVPLIVKCLIGGPIFIGLLLWLLDVHLSGSAKTGTIIFGAIWLLAIVMPALSNAIQRTGYKLAIQDFTEEIMSQRAMGGTLPADLQRAFDNWAIRSAKIELARNEEPSITRH